MSQPETQISGFQEAIVNPFGDDSALPGPTNVQAGYDTGRGWSEPIGRALGDLAGGVTGNLVGGAVGILGGGVVGGLIGGRAGPAGLAGGALVGAGYGAHIGSHYGGNAGEAIGQNLGAQLGGFIGGIIGGFLGGFGIIDFGGSRTNIDGSHSLGDLGIARVNYPNGSFKVALNQNNSSTTQREMLTIEISADGALTVTAHQIDGGGVRYHVYSIDENSSVSILNRFGADQSLIEQRILRSDGTETVHSYDHANAVWNLVTDEYDASGARLRQNVYYDNGDYQFNFWDAHDTAFWDVYTDRHVASGARQTERVYNDDRSYRFYYYDANQQNTWSTVAEEFDALGRRTSQSVYNDDGSRVTVTFDATGTQNWATVSDSYNAAGVRVQTITYDDGTILVV